jgi:hypothetical protein
MPLSFPQEQITHWIEAIAPQHNGPSKKPPA